MSDSIRAIVERLRTQIATSPKSVYSSGRARQPVLMGHESPASVLDTLAKDDAVTYPERDALSRALLEEHRKSREPLWASILIVAYYPLLSHLRRRLITRSVPREELDQVVLTAFLAGLTDIPLTATTDRIPMRLRQFTERQVFAFLKKEREQQHESLDREQTALLAAKAAPDREQLRGEDMLDLALLLERAAEEGIPQSSLEVVAATVLRRELLRNYVERITPEPADRERMYQRLKRQRSRVLHRLRELVA